MILRLALFGLMALGLFGFGAVAWVSAHPQSAATQARAEKPVAVSALVLARNVRAGALLRAEDLGARTLPRADLAADALLDAPEIAEQPDRRHGSPLAHRRRRAATARTSCARAITASSPPC